MPRLLLHITSALAACGVVACQGVAPPSDEGPRATASVLEEAPAAAASAPDEAVLAEWTFEERGRPPAEVVRIYVDGRVSMSHDLLYGGEPLHEGRLGEHELQRLKEALSRLTHGVPAEPTAFSEAFGRAHRIRIAGADGGGSIDLATSMRFIELGGLAVPNLWITPKSAGGWTELDGEGTRFEALQRASVEEIALRAAWLELEAELLRAAGHAVVPGEAGPVRRLELHE